MALNRLGVIYWGGRLGMEWINKPNNEIDEYAVCLLHTCTSRNTPSPCTADSCAVRFCGCLWCLLNW